MNTVLPARDRPVTPAAGGIEEAVAVVEKRPRRQARFLEMSEKLGAMRA